MRVKWLRVARENLEAEAEYIAKDNPAAAARVVTAIDRAVKSLQRFPAIGRPGRVMGTRELVVPGTPYVVPYRVRNDAVEALRVFLCRAPLAKRVLGTQQFTPRYPLLSSGFPQGLERKSASAGRSQPMEVVVNPLDYGAQAIAHFVVTRVVDIFFGPARIRLASYL